MPGVGTLMDGPWNLDGQRFHLLGKKGLCLCVVYTSKKALSKCILLGKAEVQASGVGSSGRRRLNSTAAAREKKLGLIFNVAYSRIYQSEMTGINLSCWQGAIGNRRDEGMR